MHIVKLLKCANVMMQYALHEDIYDALICGNETNTKHTDIAGSDGIISNSQKLSDNMTQLNLNIVKKYNLQVALITLQIKWTHACSRVLRSKQESRKAELYNLLKQRKNLTEVLIRECHLLKVFLFAKT